MPHVNPDDPLGVDEIVKARREWDAQLEADRQRWDAISPLPGPELRINTGSSPELMLKPEQTARLEQVARLEQNRPADLVEQDDLSALDRELGIVNTEKIGPVDEVLQQPPQDPDWRPAGDTL